MINESVVFNCNSIRLKCSGQIVHRHYDVGKSLHVVSYSVIDKSKEVNAGRAGILIRGNIECAKWIGRELAVNEFVVSHCYILLLSKRNHGLAQTVRSCPRVVVPVLIVGDPWIISRAVTVRNLS